MFRLIVFLVGIFFSQTIAAKWEISVGHGLSYGGILGGQFAYSYEKFNLYSSIGIGGLAFGSELLVSDNKKHAVDLSFGAGLGFGLNDTDNRVRALSGFVSAGYRYHISSFENAGWVIGTSLVHAKAGDGVFTELEDTSSLMFSAAYHF